MLSLVEDTREEILTLDTWVQSSNSVQSAGMNDRTFLMDNKVTQASLIICFCVLIARTAGNVGRNCNKVSLLLIFNTLHNLIE